MFWWIGVYAAFLWCYNGFLASLLSILWGTLKNVLRREPFPKRYGKWAIITGASDGIGREYAEQLAQKDMNILLLSRSEHKLIKVASEIESKYNVQTKWIAVDFSKGIEIYEPIRKQLASIEVGMLVNNVGHLPPPSQTFTENSDQDINSVLRLNVFATTMMTKLILPGMLARRKGIIINVSSSSGYHPVPGMAIYAASKVYTTNFGLALTHELRGTGVECQTVTPFLVKTNMVQKFTENLSPYEAVLDVRTYLNSAVCTIGKTAFTCGHWLHTLQLFYINVVSPSLAMNIIGNSLKNRRAEMLKSHAS